MDTNAKHLSDIRFLLGKIEQSTGKWGSFVGVDNLVNRGHQPHERLHNCHSRPRFTQSTYGKNIEDILNSFVSRTSYFDQEFLRDNDYFLRFLRFQRQLYIGLSEEMKTKIILSVFNTSKIITDSNKDSISQCKKELADLDLFLAERSKWVKQ